MFKDVRATHAACIPASRPNKLGRGTLISCCAEGPKTLGWATRPLGFILAAGVDRKVAGLAELAVSAELEKSSYLSIR